jgi:ubiquinone/menaquinone biosynthesis C-methylase UbiE
LFAGLVPILRLDMMCAVMKKTDYNADHASRYDAARAMIPEMREAWLAAVKKYIQGDHNIRIIDIGSGTGRFSELFVSELPAAITGVEPSDEMRKIAENKRSSDKITYLKGGAERLPIVDERFDLAWLSMVIHHLHDRKACAAETARVLDTDGIAIVRNSFRGRLDGFEFMRYFPSALDIENERLPSIEEVISDFEGAGLEYTAHELVQQTFAESFPALIERMRHRGVSTLRLISDAEFQEGLARMEEVQKSGTRTGPVTEVIDMLVFKRT